MKADTSSMQSVPAPGELSLCMVCTGLCLLGNGWLVTLNVAAPVLVAYATMSGAFAFVANATAICRYVRQSRAR